MVKKVKKQTMKDRAQNLQRKILNEFGVPTQHNTPLKVKQARRMANEAWGNIPHEDGEEVITWDPMGFRTGEPISLYPDIYESVKPGLKAFDQALENGVRGQHLHLAYNQGLEEAEKDVTFLGLVGMTDPPREGVEEAITVCHDAGIRTGRSPCRQPGR